MSVPSVEMNHSDNMSSDNESNTRFDKMWKPLAMYAKTKGAVWKDQGTSYVFSYLSRQLKGALHTYQSSYGPPVGSTIEVKCSAPCNVHVTADVDQYAHMDGNFKGGPGWKVEADQVKLSSYWTKFKSMVTRVKKVPGGIELGAKKKFFYRRTSSPYLLHTPSCPSDIQKSISSAVDEKSQGHSSAESKEPTETTEIQQAHNTLHPQHLPTHKTHSCPSCSSHHDSYVYFGILSKMTQERLS